MGERTPDPLVKAEPGPLSLQRLAGAAIIVREKKLPVLITGARVGFGQPAVATLMADLFTDAFGLPVEWRETKAENTCENARYSAEILRKAGINSALGRDPCLAYAACDLGVPSGWFRHGAGAASRRCAGNSRLSGLSTSHLRLVAQFLRAS